MPIQAVVDLLTPPVIAFLLVAVGLDLTVDDFRRVRGRPGMVAAGVLLPPIVLPVLALALIAAIEPSPAMAAGLLLLVVCPIGGVSTVYSAAANASTALSVTLTAVSCTAAVATIPLATWWLGVLRGAPMPHAVPWPVLLGQLLVGLAPPVLLGMAIRRRWPAAAERHRPAVQALGAGLFLLLLVLVAASAGTQAAIDWWSALALVAAFVVVAFALGGMTAAALGAHDADRFTLSAEFATRNVAVALGVAAAQDAAVAFIWFGALYLAVEAPILMAAAAAYRTLARRAGKRRQARMTRGQHLTEV